MKKNTPTTQEIPRLLETVYEYNGIKVGVRINFREKKISLTDTDGQGTKQWYFNDRDIKYMNGWRNILDAMRYAIDTAEAVLREYIEKEEAEKERLVLFALSEDVGIGVEKPYPYK